MNYPIFNSIVNTIDTELVKRNIDITTFRNWNEHKINAAGLEIEIALTNRSHFIRSVVINFDWDRFRETVLARQLKGMEKHPLLNEKTLTSTSIKPLIDIEVVWKFDESATQSHVGSKIGDERLRAASNWMSDISRDVNELLYSDDIITRWHIEVEGDEYGKYLSAINLLSYFQYSFDGFSTLNQIQQFVSRKLQHLLFKTNKVVQISNKRLNQSAA